MVLPVNASPLCQGQREQAVGRLGGGRQDLWDEMSRAFCKADVAHIPHHARRRFKAVSLKASGGHISVDDFGGDHKYTLKHATRNGNRAAERKEPTPEPTASLPPRPAPRHWTLYKQLAHARTLAEHSIQPYTEAAYVERMVQDWTKYETEVLEGHTGPQGTTSRTTWDKVVPNGDIGALATTVRTTPEDCSKPDNPFGDNYDPAIRIAILAYHSWSNQQSIHLHTPHEDPREWHPVGPPALEFYLHEDATTGAQGITSLRQKAPQPIREAHIPPSPTKPHTPPQNNSLQGGQSHQPKRGRNLQAPPRPSNNSPSPSTYAMSWITTNYPEEETTTRSRQRHCDYGRATLIG